MGGGGEGGGGCQHQSCSGKLPWSCPACPTPTTHLQPEHPGDELTETLRVAIGDSPEPALSDLPCQLLLVECCERGPGTSGRM